MSGAGELSAALERAFRELPSGRAEARLAHYCGRLWDLLRSPELIESHRRAIASGGATQDEVDALLVSCLAAVAALVTEGIGNGEFAEVSSRGVARLLVSSLFVRALWCDRGGDPRLAGTCSRTVVETLDLIRPALGRSATEVSPGPLSDSRSP